VLFAGLRPASQRSGVLVRGGDPPDPPRGLATDSAISPLALLGCGCGCSPLGAGAGCSPLGPLGCGCGCSPLGAGAGFSRLVCLDGAAGFPSLACLRGGRFPAPGSAGRRGLFLVVGPVGPVGPVGRWCGFRISGIWAARGAVGLRRDHRSAGTLRNGALTDGFSLDAGQAGLQCGNQRDFMLLGSWLSSSHSAAERTSGAHMYSGEAGDEGRGPWVLRRSQSAGLLITESYNKTA
jgi:hypothetical protein